jgi:hypothetical protein
MAKGKTGGKRPSAKAKPMRGGPRIVAKEPLPYPKDEVAAEYEFKVLQAVMEGFEKYKAEEAAAKTRKDAHAVRAKEIAERLRLYVEANGITPAFNTGAIAFVAGTYALTESSRDSAYLTTDPSAFIDEARKHGAYGIFVRVKEEPNLAAFLLGENRLKASKFASAKIEREQAVELQTQGTKARLRYVLNEQKPAWEIVFPKK